MNPTYASLPEGATAKSREDFAVAQRIAAGFERHERVTSIAVGGSIARGIGNEFSDLDLYVYCSEFPSESERRALLLPHAPQRWKSHVERESSGVIVEAFVCQRTEVDLNLVRVKTVEACLRAVLEKHDLTPIVLAFVGGFADAIPLHGHAQLEEWRRRVQAYPAALARKLVERQLEIEPLWVPGVDGCREGDLLPLYEALCRVERSLLGILVGLNHQYPPAAYKRVRRLLASMPLKPERAAERLEDVFGPEIGSAADRLRALVLETFDLVEAQMPELDVAGARKRFTSNPALADEEPR
jgi:predicted nucleotidyltransferase